MTDKLLYKPAIDSLVKVMELGFKKYGFETWKYPDAKIKCSGAIMRHINSHNSGDLYDKESGELHLSHVMANAMILQFHYLKEECNNIGKKIASEK